MLSKMRGIVQPSPDANPAANSCHQLRPIRHSTRGLGSPQTPALPPRQLHRLAPEESRSHTIDTSYQNI